VKIYTPTDAAKQAGNKYLGVLVAAKFARHINELPRERIPEKEQKLTTQALEKLCVGDLLYKISRRRRSEA
jgi:DNA-directed RNA polymerase subunit K/omega